MTPQIDYDKLKRELLQAVSDSVAAFAQAVSKTGGKDDAFEKLALFLGEKAQAGLLEAFAGKNSIDELVKAQRSIGARILTTVKENSGEIEKVFGPEMAKTATKVAEQWAIERKATAKASVAGLGKVTSAVAKQVEAGRRMVDGANARAVERGEEVAESMMALMGSGRDRAAKENSSAVKALTDISERFDKERADQTVKSVELVKKSIEAVGEGGKVGEEMAATARSESLAAAEDLMPETVDPSMLPKEIEHLVNDKPSKATRVVINSITANDPAEQYAADQWLAEQNQESKEQSDLSEGIVDELEERESVRKKKRTAATRKSKGWLAKVLIALGTGIAGGGLFALGKFMEEEPEGFTEDQVARLIEAGYTKEQLTQVSKTGLAQMPANVPSSDKGLSTEEMNKRGLIDLREAAKKYGIIIKTKIENMPVYINRELAESPEGEKFIRSLEGETLTETIFSHAEDTIHWQGLKADIRIWGKSAEEIVEKMRKLKEADLGSLYEYNENNFNAGKAVSDRGFVTELSDEESRDLTVYNHVIALRKAGFEKNVKETGAVAHIDIDATKTFTFKVKEWGQKLIAKLRNKTKDVSASPTVESSPMRKKSEGTDAQPPQGKEQKTQPTVPGKQANATINTSTSSVVSPHQKVFDDAADTLDEVNKYLQRLT